MNRAINLNLGFPEVFWPDQSREQAIYRIVLKSSDLLLSWLSGREFPGLISEFSPDALKFTSNRISIVEFKKQNDH